MKSDRERDQAIIGEWVATEGADPARERVFLERWHELEQRLGAERMTLGEAAEFMRLPIPVFQRIWAVKLARGDEFAMSHTPGIPGSQLRYRNRQ